MILAFPQFLLLFDKGLGKPLSKASSGQTSDERGNQLSSARRSLLAMETSLFYSEAVLANEAFPKGFARPDLFVRYIDPNTGRQVGNDRIPEFWKLACLPAPFPTEGGQGGLPVLLPLFHPRMI
jgi:hypothetical protein